MEINEKLDIFYQAAIEAANGQSAAMLDEYRIRYEEDLADYRKTKQEQQRSRERIAQERVRKEANRALSEEMVKLKKEYHRTQEEKKRELFILVEQKLAEYRRSKEYPEWLKRKVKAALELAKGAELRVYIDPEDANLKQELENASGNEILVSAYAFGGGIRAVIPSKHILLDESFDSKLAEEKERFSF